MLTLFAGIILLYGEIQLLVSFDSMMWMHLRHEPVSPQRFSSPCSLTVQWVWKWGDCNKDGMEWGGRRSVSCGIGKWDHLVKIKLSTPIPLCKGKDENEYCEISWPKWSWTQAITNWIHLCILKKRTAKQSSCWCISLEHSTFNWRMLFPSLILCYCWKYQK